MGAQKKRPNAPPSTAVATSRIHQFDKKLALYLVRRWAWGHKSSAEVQREALKAYEDELDLLDRVSMSADYASKSLKCLAWLGSKGALGGNIFRDLKTLLGDPKMIECAWEMVPMVVAKPEHGAETVRVAPFPLLLPHEMFAALYKYCLYLYCH